MSEAVGTFRALKGIALLAIANPKRDVISREASLSDIQCTPAIDNRGVGCLGPIQNR
jgi:hypothetical protein